MGFMSFLFGSKKNEVSDTDAMTAKERDKLRKAESKSNQKKSKKIRQKKIKRTTFDTIPYKRFVSNYVMLLNDQVRCGRELLNLYSKTYLIADVNYTALAKDEQYMMLQQYAALLNLFNDRHPCRFLW